MFVNLSAKESFDPLDEENKNLMICPRLPYGLRWTQSVGRFWGQFKIAPARFRFDLLVCPALARLAVNTSYGVWYSNDWCIRL